MNIINTYNDYLIHLNNERERTKNKFHASSAGSCFRKQLYSYYEYDRDEMDDKSFRLLRLGTVVHEDIEKAIRWKTQLDKDSNYKVYVEELFYKPYSDKFTIGLGRQAIPFGSNVPYLDLTRGDKFTYQTPTEHDVGLLYFGDGVSAYGGIGNFFICVK